MINSTLPQSLWTQASALVSAMWGVGRFSVLRPAACSRNTVLALGIRVLVVLAVAIAVLVPFALPARPGVPAGRDRIPVWSLLLLGSAALAIASRVSRETWSWTVGLVVLGAGLVGVFLIVDRRASAAVLPPTAFRPGPLKWIYLTLGMLMAATMVDLYVPFFGQRLAHLAPVAAGFLGVALAVGWTVSEIASASVTRTKVVVRIVAVAPLVMALGLALASVSQFEDASGWVIAIWVVALALTGVGVGMAWPHLSAWAMGCVDDSSEGGRAAAAINTVQLIFGAFGAGLAGIVVNATDRGDATAARWMFATFAVLAVVGVVASTRSGSRTVNRHHELVEHRPAVVAAPVGPSFGRHHDAVGVHEVRNVLNRQEAARDVHAVVVARQQQVGPEVELLQRAVADEAVGNRELQAGQCSAVVFDRVELAHREPRQRQQERACQVRPQRVAVEVGPLQRIPRRVEVVAFE